MRETVVQDQPSTADTQAQTVLSYLLVVYAAAYILFAVTGAYTFIFKSMLIPAFALYAVMTRAIGQFVRAWFPFLAATVLFDALRGGIFRLVEAGYRPVYAQYAIDLERLITGTPAICLPLQAHLRSSFLDGAMVVVHGGHFVYFLLFGLVLWHSRRQLFAHYTWSMLGIFYLGALCYLLVPTVPPWMAAEQGLLPPVEHVTRGVYNMVFPELYGSFDTNPVAAMPSLHTAFPVACMLIAWRAFSRGVAVATTVYAATVAFAIMYLGEHYLVDVLAGALLAGLVCGVVFRLNPSQRLPSLGLALLVTALLLAATFVVVGLT